MKPARAFSAEVLTLDASAEVERICAAIRDQVFTRLKRRGVIVAMSGGIDSSTVAALCVRALGSQRVKGLFLPESESSDDSLRFGQLVAEKFGIEAFVEDITPALKGLRCYERRDAAIRKVVPEYGPGYKSKIVLPGLSDSPGYSVFYLVVQAPDGTQKKVRLTAEAYLGILAATNFKQRVRKMFEYHYADLYNFATTGTPNRLEYDQGFFVKLGDGAADLKPIAHLYKTQVYQVAEHLGVPSEVLRRPPTTDTYTLQQGQDEFYFVLPYNQMDLCLYALNHGISAAEAAGAVGILPDAVERVFEQIRTKRRVTQYLHSSPLLVEDVKEIIPHAGHGS